MLWIVCSFLLLVVFLSETDANNFNVQDLECKLVSQNGEYYFIMLGFKMHIIGADTLSNLFFSPADAIVLPADSKILSTIPNDEDVMCNFKRFFVLRNLIRTCGNDRPSHVPSEAMKGLIVMVENRPLNPNTVPFEHASFVTLDAVLNYQYALEHDYDMIIVNVRSEGLMDEVHKLKLNVSTAKDFYTNRHVGYMSYNASASESAIKDSVSLYNSNLQILRPSPWAKIPVLLFIMKMLRQEREKGLPYRKYDVIMYIDSDAAMTPKYRRRSISDFFDYWGNLSYQSKECGVKINNASMVFLSNSWLENLHWPELPCTGFILLRTDPDDGLLNEELLLDWWNTDDKPEYEYYEQHNIWDMIKSKHKITNHLAYIHAEMQVKLYTILRRRIKSYTITYCILYILYTLYIVIS